MPTLSTLNDVLLLISHHETLRKMEWNFSDGAATTAASKTTVIQNSAKMLVGSVISDRNEAFGKVMVMVD